jgi:hypothetical protein
VRYGLTSLRPLELRTGRIWAPETESDAEEEEEPMSRRPLTYAEHCRAGEHLWWAGEHASTCYRLARVRFPKHALAPLDRLVLTPSQFDAIKNVMDTALFADCPAYPTRTLCAVYYGVTLRLAQPRIPQSWAVPRRTQPLTDAQYTALGRLLQQIRAEAHAAWALAVQRLSRAQVARLERIWQTGGTLDRLGLLFERGRCVDAQRGTCTAQCWPWGEEISA